MNISKPSDEVQGLLKGVSLINFLQLIEVGGDTCLLEIHQDSSDVNSSDVKGQVYIFDGVLYDATFKSLSGTDAAIEMLQWDQVTILIRELPDENLTKKIEKSLASLILMIESNLRPAKEINKMESLNEDTETPEKGLSDSIEKTTVPQNKLKSILKKMAEEMDGLIATAIIAIDDGLQIEQLGNRKNIIAKSASVYLAKVVKSNREALKLMGWDRQPEDILITTHNRYLIIRQLPGDTYFLYVMTARDEWIGRTRVQMAAFAEELATTLDLIQK